MTDACDLLVVEIANGQGLTPPQLARRIGVDPSCVARWILKGTPGRTGERVRLAAIRRGKAWLTTAAAYERWLGEHPRSDAPASPQAPPPRSPAERRRGHDAAMAKLRARGIA